MRGRYTSHMTGYLSQVADNLVLHDIGLFLQGAVAIVVFILGAAAAAMIINWARHHRTAQQYALTIAAQGPLFLVVGLLGALDPAAPLTRNAAFAPLCFMMGFQNATITKISGARIRTTHATGMITDVGIEQGRATYGRLFPADDVMANRRNLLLLLQILAACLVGGTVGAFGYGQFGCSFSLLLAAILLTLALAHRA